MPNQFAPNPDDLGSPESIENLTQLVEEAKAQYRETMANIDEKNKEINQITQVEHNSDKTVTVTVNARGTIQSINLTEKSYEKNPQQLGAEITKLIHTAQRNAQNKTKAIMEQKTQTNGAPDIMAALTAYIPEIADIKKAVDEEKNKYLKNLETKPTEDF